MYLFESRPVIVAVVQTDEWFFGFSIFAGKWMNAGLYWGQGCIFKWGGRREMGGQLDYKQFLWFPLYIPQLSQILSGHARAEEWSLMAWRCLQALVTAGMCTRKLFFFFTDSQLLVNENVHVSIFYGPFQAQEALTEKHVLVFISKNWGKKKKKVLWGSFSFFSPVLMKVFKINVTHILNCLVWW